MTITTHPVYPIRFITKQKYAYLLKETTRQRENFKHVNRTCVCVSELSRVVVQLTIL